MINLAKLQQHHERFLRAHDGMVTQELILAGEFGVEYAEKHPRFTPRSADGLAKSNEYKILRTRGGRLLRLRNTKRHAPYIEYGTRPHDIKPRRASRLVFFWPKVGRTVYAKRVKHPGTKPYRFLLGAFEATTRRTYQNLRTHMRLIAKRYF